MVILKLLFISSYIFMFSGCGVSWFAGGADYKYLHVNPDGTETKISVHSVRQFESGIKVELASNGTATIETGAVTSGPNNMVLIPVTLEQLGKILIAVP